MQNFIESLYDVNTAVCQFCRYYYLNISNPKIKRHNTEEEYDKHIEVTKSKYRK